MKNAVTRPIGTRRPWRTLPSVLAFAVLAGVVASVAAARAGGEPPRFRAEETLISSGAFVDQLIQANPERFRVSSSAPDAPPLGGNFDAVNFDENATQTGFFQIPPDPAGAVGPNHLVNVVNSTIEWYTKAGVLQNRQSLKTFFAAATSPPQTITFDPKVIYDHYSNRFVVLTMERIEAAGATPNQSRVYLAVSDDADPNGTWFFHTLTTEETIGPNQSWADFPGLAVDSEAVYFTTNMFAHNNQPNAGFFQGERLWIIAKAPFYSGGAATATRHDPVALANAGTGDTGLSATTFQPALMYGDTPGGVGTYLVSYGGVNDGTNVVLQVIRVDTPLASPTFTGYRSRWGTIAADDSAPNSALPDAPQLGTTRVIETNDRRVSQNAVFRNGLLYLAAPVRPPAGANANQTTARWFVVDPVAIATTASDPAPVDQGNIGGEEIAAGTHTFFPSVAVDASGNLAVGFAASGPGIYPGAYYTVRGAGDPAGQTQTAGTLRAGVDYYVRAFSTSTTVSSRWGDYTGTWLDPNGTTFWVYNEFAMARGTVLGCCPSEDGRWKTAWGSFSFTPTAVTLQSLTATRSQRGTVVRWRTASDVGVLGYDVYGEIAGKRVKLNRTLVATAGSASGGVYRFTYSETGGVRVSRFWLRSVAASGSRAWFGPVRVRPR